MWWDILASPVFFFPYFEAKSGGSKVLLRYLKRAMMLIRPECEPMTLTCICCIQELHPAHSMIYSHTKATLEPNVAVSNNSNLPRCPPPQPPCHQLCLSAGSFYRLAPVKRLPRVSVMSTPY